MGKCFLNQLGKNEFSWGAFQLITWMIEIFSPTQKRIDLFYVFTIQYCDIGSKREIQSRSVSIDCCNNDLCNSLTPKTSALTTTSTTTTTPVSSTGRFLSRSDCRNSLQVFLLWTYSSEYLFNNLLLKKEKYIICL
jgi:hypothetical protein